MQNCRGKKLESMVELCIPHCMSLQNVKEGVYAQILSVNVTSHLPKLRKQLLKQYHPFIVSMACDKDAHLLVIRCLDVIDDTVLF